jgi:hypothetical protein
MEGCGVGPLEGWGCGQPREQPRAVGYPPEWGPDHSRVGFRLALPFFLSRGHGIGRVGLAVALPLPFPLLLSLPPLLGIPTPQPRRRELLQQVHQVDQAEWAADDHAGAVGGEGRVALAGLEEDHQGAGVVAADPGVDAVALAGGDVEDDGG